MLNHVLCVCLNFYDSSNIYNIIYELSCIDTPKNPYAVEQ